MSTTYTYRMIAFEEGWLARCVETGLEAIGRGRDSAVSALEAALTAELTRCEAVAPPAGTVRSKVNLVEGPPDVVGPFGPGDAGPTKPA